MLYTRPLFISGLGTGVTTMLPSVYISEINEEIEIVARSTSWDFIKETFTNVTTRRRFVLMFMCHLFSQWSGANAITQYSQTILQYLGIQGEEVRFLTTGIYAIVKSVSTLLVVVFVIDFIGRRRALMIGISMQILTLTFIGAYLGVTSKMTPEEIANSASTQAVSKALIVAIFIHAVAWSVGWFSIPYLVSSEIFPIRIRSLNVSILMACHWAFYFGCSKAMPSLLVATDRYGAFALFASVCSISLVYVFMAMTETSGRSLESMGALFERPWYTVWKVAYPTFADLKPDLLPPSTKDSDSEIESRVHDSGKKYDLR